MSDSDLLLQFNAIIADIRILDILRGGPSAARGFLRKQLFLKLWADNKGKCKSCGAKEGRCVEGDCWRLDVTKELKLYSEWNTVPDPVDILKSANADPETAAKRSGLERVRVPFPSDPNAVVFTASIEDILNSANADLDRKTEQA